MLSLLVFRRCHEIVTLASRVTTASQNSCISRIRRDVKQGIVMVKAPKLSGSAQCVPWFDAHFVRVTDVLLSLECSHHV